MNAGAGYESVGRSPYRTSRSPSVEKNYLCTFLNEMGERVDVFEGAEGETFFMTHRRDAPALPELACFARAA